MACLGEDLSPHLRQAQEYEKYREITQNTDKLLTYLADINSQTPQMLAANDFETLKRAVAARLQQVAQRV
jgi:hypothetical protein